MHYRITPPPASHPLRRDQDPDLLIRIPGDINELKAHKSVLAACSSVLRDKIEKSSCSEFLELDSGSSSHFAQIVTYLYTGKIMLSTKSALDILVLAKSLEIPSLVLICEKHIASFITLDTFFDLLETSTFDRRSSLFQDCLNFWKKNAGRIVKHELQKETMRRISARTLALVLSQDFLITELVAFNFVLQWGRHRAESEPDQSLQEIVRYPMHFVRLVSISRKSLEDVVMPTGAVCPNMMLEALFRKAAYAYTSLDPHVVEAFPVDDPEAATRLKCYLYPRRGCWLKLNDFEHEGQYADYCRAVLQPGMRVRAVRAYEVVAQGDEGDFVQHNQGYPPCQILWEGYGSTYWLFWRDIEIIEL
jgi:hypothetical protein